MNHQIDMDKYINLVPKVDRLKVLEIKVIQKKQEQAVIKQCLTSATSRKDQTLHELQTLFTWKNKLLGGRFRKDKVKDLKRSLSFIEKDLEEKQKLTEELTEQIFKMESELQSLRNELQGFSYKGFEEIKDGLLVITDKSVNDLNPLFYQNQDQNKESLASKNNIKEYAMVHSTNFFPKNNQILCNYDGNKVGKSIVQYHGIKKEVKSLSHRHTVHFTLNNIVESTGDGLGTWEQPEYIVVEPFYIHQKQFVNYAVNDYYVSGDNYTWGSVDLEKPYYLVREDALDKIPKGEIEKGNIIIYQGDAGVCLRRFLKMLDYPVFGYEENDATHSNSSEMDQEMATEFRDLAVNYLQNNSFNGKEKRKFSLHEIKEILDILYENHKIRYSILNDDVVREKIQQLNISEDFFNIIVGSGIKMSKDGDFYFDTDQNIYEEICNNSKVNLANLKIVWNAYNSLQIKEEPKTFALGDINKKTIADIFLFENFGMCQTFFEQIEALLLRLSNSLQQLGVFPDPYISEDGFYLNIAFNVMFDWKYDTIKIASAQDTLEFAYANTLKYLNNIGYTLENNTQNYSRGSMNISYLLFVIAIIALGIIMSFVFLTY